MNLKGIISATTTIVVLSSFIYGGLNDPDKTRWETRTLKGYSIVNEEVSLIFEGPEPNTYISNSIKQDELQTNQQWDVKIGVPYWNWLYSEEIDYAQKHGGVNLVP
jgi:hypothetical protein